MTLFTDCADKQLLKKYRVSEVPKFNALFEAEQMPHTKLGGRW